MVDECDWTVIQDCLNLFDECFLLGQTDESVTKNFLDWHVNYSNKLLIYASQGRWLGRHDAELFERLWLETTSKFLHPHSEMFWPYHTGLVKELHRRHSDPWMQEGIDRFSCHQQSPNWHCEWCYMWTGRRNISLCCYHSLPSDDQ